MKFKPILGFCKEQKTIVIEYTTDFEWWLGNGDAMYCLTNIQRLDGDEILTIMDIAESAKGKYSIINAKDFSKDKYKKDIFENDYPGETEIIPEPIKLISNGDVAQPFVTFGGIKFINTKYLKPLAEEQYGLRYFERGKLIAIKSGLILVALIAPMNVVNEKFIKDLDRLLKNAEATLFVQREAERVKFEESDNSK